MSEKNAMTVTLEPELADALVEAADYIYTHYTDIDGVALMRTANEVKNALEALKLATANNGSIKINVTEDEYLTLRRVASYARKFFTLDDQEMERFKTIRRLMPNP